MPSSWRALGRSRQAMRRDLYCHRQSTPEKLTNRIRWSRAQRAFTMLLGNLGMPGAPIQIAQYGIPEIRTRNPSWRREPFEYCESSLWPVELIAADNYSAGTVVLCKSNLALRT